ncbi:MAG: hypothetical protein ACOX6S_00030 [Clostridia bacterium]
MRSVDIAGTLTGEAASLLGLPEGIPVAVGGGDGACATKGAGVVEEGLAYNYIGSSSWIAFLNDGPVLDTRLFNFYRPGRRALQCLWNGAECGHCLRLGGGKYRKVRSRKAEADLRKDP